MPNFLFLNALGCGTDVAHSTNLSVGFRFKFEFFALYTRRTYTQIIILCTRTTKRLRLCRTTQFAADESRSSSAAAVFSFPLGRTGSHAAQDDLIVPSCVCGTCVDVPFCRRVRIPVRARDNTFCGRHNGAAHGKESPILCSTRPGKVVYYIYNIFVTIYAIYAREADNVAPYSEIRFRYFTSANMGRGGGPRLQICARRIVRFVKTDKKSTKVDGSVHVYNNM